MKVVSTKEDETISVTDSSESSSITQELTESSSSQQDTTSVTDSKGTDGPPNEGKPTPNSVIGGRWIGQMMCEGWNQQTQVRTIDW